MGEHRASIKIEMEVHGKSYEVDMWINYFPEHDGADSRVAEWFNTSWEDSLIEYERLAAQYDAEDRERSDRATFERLAKKYARR